MTAMRIAAAAACLLVGSPAVAQRSLLTADDVLGIGEVDWNIPVSQSEQLYQSLRRRGIDTTLVVYQDKATASADPRTRRIAMSATSPGSTDC